MAEPNPSFSYQSKAFEEIKDYSGPTHSDQAAFSHVETNPTEHYSNMAVPPQSMSHSANRPLQNLVEDVQAPVPNQPFDIKDLFLPKITKFGGVSLVKVFYVVFYIVGLISILLWGLYGLIDAFIFHWAYAIFWVFPIGLIFIAMYTVLYLGFIRIVAEFFISIFVMRDKLHIIANKYV